MHAGSGGRHRDRRAERNAAISIYWLNTPSTLQHFVAEREMQKGGEEIKKNVKKIGKKEHCGYFNRVRLMR